jgi:hypothetical protein
MLNEIKMKMFSLRNYLFEHIDEYPDNYRINIQQLYKNLNEDSLIFE